MRAVRFHQTGGPDVLQVDEAPLPEPGPGEVRVRVRHAGVNFIDTYLRAGSYDPGPLPATAGKEGAGRVDAVGSGVRDLAAGDRVAFFDARGAYAEAVVIPAARAIRVPLELDDRQAAALPLQGMTAHYLTHEIRPLEEGDTVLIHAAAGGVGHLAVQMAKLAGAVVLATCSTEEKASRVRDLGADHVIRYDRVDFADEALKITGGRGVDVAIDGVGRSTFVDSVRATRVRGHVIFFGQSSGPPDPVQPRRLLGSRTLTTASLFDYTRTRADLLALAEPVMAWAAAGSLIASIDRVLVLEEAGRAHELLEGRRTMGKILLEP
ncbi:MAG TPA: quinone oxidoreductase [Gemmatimonadota bacterium]|nr:quinone oxidoreductase [Gemmatimonadota bacterium]